MLFLLYQVAVSEKKFFQIIIICFLICLFELQRIVIDLNLRKLFDFGRNVLQNAFEKVIIQVKLIIKPEDPAFI